MNIDGVRDEFVRLKLGDYEVLLERIREVCLVGRRRWYGYVSVGGSGHFYLFLYADGGGLGVG